MQAQGYDHGDSVFLGVTYNSKWDNYNTVVINSKLNAYQSELHNLDLAGLWLFIMEGITFQCILSFETLNTKSFS